MASANKQRHGDFAVELFSKIDEGNVVREINVKSDDVREQVFDAYGVESVGELGGEIATAGSEVVNGRLGVLRDGGDGTVFISEVELLATVEGIGESLAECLISEYGDIPSICKEYRMSGDVFLGDLLHDVRVEGRDWVESLEELCDDLSGGFSDSLEQRLKDAGVWVEPEDVAAHA